MTVEERVKKVIEEQLSVNPEQCYGFGGRVRY